MNRLIWVMSHGRSEGLILTTLFGMQSLAIDSQRVVIFIAYVSRLSSRSALQSVSAALDRRSCKSPRL